MKDTHAVHEPVANSYAGPTTLGPPDRRRALQSAVAAWMTLVLAIVVFELCASKHAAFAMGRQPMWFLVIGALAMVGVVFAARAVAIASRAGRRALSVAGIVALLLNYAVLHFGALIAFASTMTFTRGRQLRRFGRVLLPRVSHGDSWAARREPPAFVSALDAHTRALLAEQWRDNGRTEHASVAAFARLALDLVALGAPPELIAAANQDALDEIRHTEMCFTLARSIDGTASSPTAFPEAARARTLPRFRPLALAMLAVDSLVDGALHEGVSARVIAKLARRTEDPVVRAMLKEIAADEGRHARHGWDVVRWCLAEGGDVVDSALRGALTRLPQTMSSELPEAARLGGWERFGIMGQRLERDEYVAARAELLGRVSSLLSSRRGRHPQAGEAATDGDRMAG